MAEQYTYKDSMLSLRESQKKFDYFFMGVTLAFLAFSVEKFEYNKNYEWILLVPVGWVLLLISLLAGMFRQESITTFLRYEVKKLQYEPRAELFEMAANGQGTIVKDPLGSVRWDPAAIKSENQKMKEIMKSIKDGEDNMMARMMRGYQIQKWAFVLGLISSIVFKIVNFKVGGN